MSCKKIYVKAHTHNWVQCIPLNENILVCSDCGAKTKIGKWDVVKCNEKLIQLSWLPKKQQIEYLSKHGEKYT